jgi:insulysin
MQAEEDAQRAKGPSLNVGWVAGGTLVGAAAFLALVTYVGVRINASHNISALDKAALANIDVVQLTDKPVGDERTYQYFKLENGLEGVNVQDPKSTHAAFSVAVDAGSLDNPKNLPGLAHFCEHMLFLGTKSYPDPAGFDNFVGSAGGYNNAFTADEHTVYFVELTEKSSAEGLSRIGDFFRAPLFNEKFVSKELNAIQSEHDKNVQDPNRRTFEIFNSLGNPASPESWFKTGNTETLLTTPAKSGIEPVAALKSWFGEHYCPSRLKLATFGPKSPQEQLIEVSKNFADISKGSEACQAKRKQWTDPAPWPKERMGKFVAIEGLQPQSEMWVHFPMPDFSDRYKSGALSYLNYVISYGGEDGLIRVLKDRLGLVTGFGLTGSGGPSGYQLYLVASLTKTGRMHYQSILDVVFSYLRKVRVAGVNTELYTSLADIASLQWDWGAASKPSDTVSSLSEQMFKLPPKDLLSGGGRIDEQDPALIKTLMEKITPDNMNIALVDPNANETLFPGQKVQELAHYKAPFAVSELSKEHAADMKRWQELLNGAGASTPTERANSQTTNDPALIKALKDADITVSSDFKEPVMPQIIKGVPKKLDIEHMKAKPAASADEVAMLYGERPVRIVENDGSNMLDPQAWYRSGWSTKSPRMRVNMDFVVPRKADSFEVDPEDAIKMSLYSTLLGEEINPKMFDLSMTGVAYSMRFAPHGMKFSFGGFQPLMPELMTRVLAEFDKGVNVTDPTRYNRAVKEMELGLNTYSEMPISYAIGDRSILISPGSWSQEEQAVALKKITPEATASVVKDMLLSKPLSPQILTMGNLNLEEAKSAYDMFDKRSKTWSGATAKLAADEKIRRVAPVLKPATPVEVRKLNMRPADPNDAIVVSFLADVSTVENRVINGILTAVLKTTAYTYLRTSLQLGYVVNAGIQAVGNVQYVSCVVQGDKLNADKMEGAVEYALTTLVPQAVSNLTTAEVSTHMESMKQMLLQPPTTTDEEFGFFLNPIAEGGNCFHLRDEMLDYLNSGAITQALLSSAWNDLTAPKQGVRSKILIKHFGKKVPERPTKAESRELWKEQGVPESSMALLEREYDAAVVLDKVDSQARKELAKTGSFYPVDVNCKRKDVAPSLIEERIMRSDHRPGRNGRSTKSLTPN